MVAVVKLKFWCSFTINCSGCFHDVTCTLFFFAFITKAHPPLLCKLEKNVCAFMHEQKFEKFILSLNVLNCSISISLQ